MSVPLRSIVTVVGLSLVAAAASAQPVREPTDPSNASRLVQLPEVEWRMPLPEQAALDPNKAFSRALLGPGLGHFYCGESTRGALLLGAAGGGLIAGLLLSGDGKYNPETHKESRGRTPLLIGGGIAVAAYAVSLLDSRASCTRMSNRR